jgi:hypothetical protein
MVDNLIDAGLELMLTRLSQRVRTTPLRIRLMSIVRHWSTTQR